MTAPTLRSCATCVLCLRADYGYSNYTVMGTELFCLAGLNPALDQQEEPFGDLTPKQAAALDVALTCPRYRFGAPAWLDVDRDDIPSNKTLTAEMVKAARYTDDDEAAELLAQHAAKEPRP